MRTQSIAQALSTFALALALLPPPSTASAGGDEDLTVLRPTPEGVTPDRFLEIWLSEGFNAMVDRRSEAFETMIKSSSAARAWQEDRRAFFLERIGGLPERTPLNPRVTGTLQGDGYRVENLILETRPSFHLTANLYLPETPGPWPAVLVPCGHSHNGKASGQYQLVCMLMARHGLAAICYDPIGQGERYQILDPARTQDVFEDAPHVKTPHPHARLLCTTEHTMVGLSSALLGENVAQYRIWDGMRVIDYLQSRDDIIADKIGCTGNSGGGTETAYLMALDDRIVAASPGCYLTTFRNLVEKKGPQDGEQNIFGQIDFGMDQADYCIMRAPKPTLIAAGTRDATFDFDGTWEVFRDAKRFSSRIGHPDSVDIAAPDAPHGFTLQLREAVTRFMCRHLLGEDVEVREIESLPDSFSDTELRAFSEPDWTDDQLRCTPEGQVLLMPGEKSAFEINAETAAALKAVRTPVWAELDEEAKRRVVRETIGAGSPDEAVSELGPVVETVGTFERGNATVHKLVLTAEPGLPLPALAFVPKEPRGGVVLYLHGDGMKADAAPGGSIDALVKEGRIVLAAELRGIGETETGYTRRAWGAGRFGRDNLEIFTAYLMGKSYVGMRTGDVQSWTRYLRSAAFTGSELEGIELVASGVATLPALHAAALHPDNYASIELRRMIPSWEAIVTASETFEQSVNVVHGALRHYDLDDLVALAGKEETTLAEPVDVMGNPLPPDSRQDLR